MVVGDVEEVDVSTEVVEVDVVGGSDVVTESDVVEVDVLVIPEFEVDVCIMVSLSRVGGTLEKLYIP